MREYGYTVTEHDPDRPWLIVNSQHRSISLLDDQGFFDWASSEWPRDRFTVTLDPWALSEGEPGAAS